MHQDLFVGQSLLDGVTEAAKAHARKRKNHNFHSSDEAVCHRLLNAIEPGSYVAPHCHLEASKDESIIALRGRLGVVIFGDDGRVAETAVLQPGGTVVAVNIPHGVFHTMVALESGTVFFESKAGPYRPLTPEEKAAWSPAEGDAGAAAYLAKMAALFA
ncbi:MAG: WbuC family cupin fold metalloprotein [Burkholderiales bacterium]